jgi:putative transposase
MIAFIADRMMDLDVESLTGAAHGERSPERTNHRNGYGERTWETRAGSRSRFRSSASKIAAA